MGVEVGKKEGVEVGKKEGVEVGKKVGVEVGKKVGVEVGNNNKKWLQTKSFFIANKLIAKPTIHALNN